MKVQTLLLSCAVVTLAGCANQRYRADVGAMFAVTNGDIALQNAAGNLPPTNQNDLDANMGLGDTEPSPYLRVQMDSEKHRVRLHGFGIDTEGSGVLQGDYGGIVAGSTVSTSMEFLAMGGAYAYEVLRDERFRVALGGQLNFYKLDVAARSSVGREQVETDTIVPMPYVEAETFVGPVTIGANAGIMAADLGDASGRYWDMEAYGRWQINEKFDVMLGYRYVLLDAYGRASSRDFDADVDIQGVFLSGGIRF